MQPDAILNNRYRIIYTVDERPSGHLLRARDEQNGGLVLVGVVPAVDAHAIAALARQIASFHHESVIALSDHFAVDRGYVLVSPDPGGQTLDQALRSRGGPLPEQDVLAQATKLLHAVDAFHGQKPPLHIGDIWSSDILVVNNVWHVLPFALARLVSPVPTPYRAPELADTNVEPSNTTDTYALAGLLYYALTATAPPTPEQQQAGVPLQAPRTLNPELAPLLEQTLLRGLQQKAANRYQNARELRLALETVHLMEGRSLGLGPDAMPQAEQTTAPATVQLEPAPEIAPAQVMYEPEPEANAPRRGLSTGCLIGLALGLAALVILIAVGLLYVLLTSSPFANFIRPSMSGGRTGVAAVAPGPNAITASNINAITYTTEITGDMLGPIAYAPGGDLVAIGVGNSISMASPDLRELRRFSGQSGEIFELVFSPDGSLVASSSAADTVARVWNTADGTLVHTLSGHAGWIRSLAFSPDGSQLATGSVDATVRLWNVADGSLVATLEGHTNWVGGVAFLPDGQRLFSTSRDGTVRAWNVANGRQITAFNYTGQRNPETNAPYSITSVVVSADGEIVAVGSTDTTIALLDATNGMLLRRLNGHENWVPLRSLVFAPNGGTLYSTSLDGTVRAWNVAGGSELGQFEGHQLAVTGISLSPDGSQLAAISSEEGSVIVWDTATRNQIAKRSEGQGLITGLAYTPDGAALGLTGFTGALKLRTSDGEQTLVSTAGSAVSTVFLSEGRLAVVTDQGEVRLLDARNRENQALGDLDGEAGPIATNPTGTIVAAGTDTGMITVWNDQGQPLATLDSEFPLVNALAVSSDGRYVAAGGSSALSQIEVWDVRSRERVQTLVGPINGIAELTFQPNGTRLAAIDFASEMFLWDAPTGGLVDLRAASEEQEQFTAIRFSPDGAMVIGGALNGELVAWNASDLSEIGRTAVAPAPVLALAFSPDGQQLAVSVRNDNASVYTLGITK